MPGSTPDKARRSRITAACAVCRAKRQKCSGVKPVCDQCKHNNEDCWWSDQKKRGPAKDYLRSLQDRLQDTERLLLSVLGQATDEQLLAALQNTRPAPSHHLWTTSLSGQEYWSRFPFKNVRSVREWESERAAASSAMAAPDVSVTYEHADVVPRPPVVIDPALSSAIIEESDATSSAKPSMYRQADQHQMHRSRGRDSARKTQLERRYSDETRDVAKTLFSISHNGETLKRDYEAHQSQELSTDDSAATEEAASKFPKHLFW